MLDWLFEHDFMPHGHCYLWRPDILWTNVVSNAVIALAYFSIPVTLLYFLRRRPDLPFPAMIVLFAAFIVLCGTGHLLDIWTIWYPVYPLLGAERAVTAIVSIATAIALVPLIPQVLAMRTPAEVQREVDQAVDQLRQTQERLVQNEKMASLGALVAGVAHEINTPVGNGVTAASALQTWAKAAGAKAGAGTLTKSDFDEFLARAQESTEIVLRNMQRAAELIQSFKQVAVDQTSGERRRFDVKAYIDEVLLSLAPHIRKTPHQVAVSCPDLLTVDSYPGAIAQILTNLVNNSLIHAFPEGRQGHIRIAVFEQGGNIVLDYSDDGIGIPTEHLSRVFDPFFTTRRDMGGSGLGLHIVYNLVAQTLGGTIDLSSRPNEGTRFRIVFTGQERPAPAQPGPVASASA